MSQDLPERYVPQQLRAPQTRERISYSVRARFGRQWSQCHVPPGGPQSELSPCLDYLPAPDEKRTCQVVRHNLDGTDEVIYRWHRGAWIRLPAAGVKPATRTRPRKRKPGKGP